MGWSTIFAVQQALFVLYVAGVAAGLWKVDAPPAKRIGLALLWPVGLAAMGVTLPILLATAVVSFPLVGAAVGALALAWALWQ